MIQPLSLSAIARLCAGRLMGDDVEISSVAIDSRKLQPGGLFVALRGERVNGHDYLASAAANGAIAALVSQPCESLPCVVVDDSYAALGAIARENRRRFNGPLVALTGSCGKTSTKDILAALLAERGPVLATAGNYNNELGVPLTLLEIAGEHDCAVIEMGAAKAGDIRYLCDFAQPQIAILTNAQAAHIEGFGSLDGVARTKGEIFEALPSDGLAVINADDVYCSQWQRQAAHCRQSVFSLTSPQADVFASDIELHGAAGSRFTLHSGGNSVSISLPLAGRHMVANALAASTVALELGLSLAQIATAMARVRVTSGRLSSQRIAGVTLIDDSYNANPGSVRAAIDVLSAERGQRALVLGTMAELGSDALAQHLDVARYAAQCGINRLLIVGEYAEPMASTFGSGASAFADQDELLAVLAVELQGIDAVLIKGSRSAAMEAVVQALQQQLSGENG